MPRTHRTASTVETPWWLQGEEHCEFCFQEYTLTLEYRCVECDQVICPHCAIVATETRQVVCPHCEIHARDREEL